MKPVNVFFFCAVLIFLGIGLLSATKIPLPSWVTSYVNDFLCMPIVLTLCMHTIHFIKQDTTIQLPLLPILSLTFFYAIYFEGYLPLVEPRYTADWMDVLLYFCGAFLFYFLQLFTPKKRPPKSI